MQQKKVFLCWLCLPLLAVGCMVGPDFQRPPVRVPAEWAGANGEKAKPLAQTEQELAQWWTLFNDPLLTTLVERAMRANLELGKAEARIRQARAARGVAAGGLGPNVDGSGSYRRSRSPVAPDGVVSDLYQFGFDAGWELDFFGGARRSLEAADADLEAAVEGRRDVLVTLTAEVASNYINLRALQQRLALAQQNLTTQEHSGALTRQRQQGGLVGGLERVAAEGQVATAASQIAPLEAAVRQTSYSLSLLMGQEPTALLAELTPVAGMPALPPPGPPAGLPSDLLRRRPDIRQAEARIHGSTARIGVATADLFPRFTLVGSVGTQSSDFGKTFNWDNRVWSFGPSVSWRLFDTGRSQAAIALQQALREEDLLSYQQTVLIALQEAENAMIAAVKEEEHGQALGRAVVANRLALALATTVYSAGQTDFLAVLDAQRSLYAAEDALVQSNRAQATDMVALFKALGGGWSEAEQKQE